MSDDQSIGDYQVPVTGHPKLPEGVPLVASFHDDRNRLSYYLPHLREIDRVRVPVTAFFPVDGDYESYPEVAYREITQFMQDVGVQEAFVRGDYSSAKFDGDAGSKIESQDPYDIESIVLELLHQLGRSKRYLGGRVAVREWIPHDREVRYFVRNGEILYRGSVDDGDEFPDEQAANVANGFQQLAWSVDFIRHDVTGAWYCTDMGLDGLYDSSEGWIAISEHLDESHDPGRYADDMPDSKRFRFHK